MIIWRLFVILAILTLARIVLGWIFPPKRTVKPPRGPVREGVAPKRMVKDPQCGMYVASELAIEARTASGSLFFCSEKCRDSYVKQIEQRG